MGMDIEFIHGVNLVVPQWMPIIMGEHPCDGWDYDNMIAEFREPYSWETMGLIGAPIPRNRELITELMERQMDGIINSTDIIEAAAKYAKEGLWWAKFAAQLEGTDYVWEVDFSY